MPRDAFSQASPTFLFTWTRREGDRRTGLIAQGLGVPGPSFRKV